MYSLTQRVMMKNLIVVYPMKVGCKAVLGRKLIKQIFDSCYWYFLDRHYMISVDEFPVKKLSIHTSKYFEELDISYVVSN